MAMLTASGLHWSNSPLRSIMHCSLPRATSRRGGRVAVRSRNCRAQPARGTGEHGNALRRAGVGYVEVVPGDEEHSLFGEQASTAIRRSCGGWWSGWCGEFSALTP
jgi:hypothetical protein